jgi:hypothetical protein
MRRFLIGSLFLVLSLSAIFSLDEADLLGIASELEAILLESRALYSEALEILEGQGSSFENISESVNRLVEIQASLLIQVESLEAKAISLENRPRALEQAMNSLETFVMDLASKIDEVMIYYNALKRQQAINAAVIIYIIIDVIIHIKSLWN